MFLFAAGPRARMPVQNECLVGVSICFHWADFSSCACHTMLLTRGESFDSFHRHWRGAVQLLPSYVFVRYRV